MITVNLDKARAIAQRLAERVTDPTARARHIDAIAKAKTADQLAAVVRVIETANVGPRQG